MQDDPLSIGGVDRVLATGFRALRFPAALEARFERDTGPARSHYLAITGLIALTLNVAFLLRDYATIADVFTLAIVVRLGIVDPLGLVGCAIIWRNPRPWLRESLDGAIVVLAVAAFLYLYLSSRSPLAAHAHYALVVVLIFPNIIQRLRFWYAVVTSVIALALCAVAIPRIAGMALPADYGAVLTLATATALSLIANWKFEHDERRRYLLNLREVLVDENLVNINRELSAATVLDPLTGLGNRRRLDQFVEALWLAHHGKGGPIAFLMIDIDFFKSFNDAYGHQAGDACLKMVAEIVQQQLRTGKDLAVRYGGEEFLVVLPDSALDAATFVAERIRSEIERRAITRPHAATGDVVTVSIGASVVVPREAETSANAVLAADRAMYAAKQTGRNRVWPPLAGREDSSAAKA